jgi:3-hydroxyacyl-CoA dehydrogenase/enoyl-CoA hydratase/3-hydroxybutyryl-CoA epimerase
VTIGLLPGVGGTQRLARLIGIREALPLMLEGRQIEPEKALEMGIVNELAPADEIVSRARRWVLDKGLAQAPWDQPGFRIPGGAGAMHPKAVETFMVGTSLMAGKTFHNYPAPKAVMSAVYEGTMVPFDTGLRIESQYFAQLISDPVARNMIRTLFINKGEADKLVRRPQGVDPSEVQKLGILGAGMMGAGIAYASARAGIPTVLLDTELAKAERGKAYSASCWTRPWRAANRLRSRPPRFWI